jgi:hypothetical protein
MPLEKLSANQLKERPRGRVNNRYLDFIQSLRSGEGGRTTTQREKATKQTIKNRLKKAAAAAAMDIDFIRTPPTEVVFKVTKKN